MSARDGQRQKLYDAEAQAFGTSSEQMTIPEIEALVAKVLGSKAILEEYPGASFPLAVTDGRSRRRGGYVFRPFGVSEIRMPKWTRSKWYVLHEIAHHLTWHRERPAHSWQFCACYLHLVRVYMGRGAEADLLAGYKAKKVRHKPPRTRAMSDEQREAARQRMIDMHARRRGDKG